MGDYDKQYTKLEVVWAMKALFYHENQLSIGATVFRQPFKNYNAREQV